MKINWKVRFKHPAFISAVLALIGFALVDFGIIDVERWENYLKLLLALITAGGVVIDPTTASLSDSPKVMNYDKPREW
jgi:phi LC3 family holin